VPSVQATGPMYCRRCSYDLRHFVEPRCPECGRAFDPADPRSYRRRPSRMNAVVLRISLALLAIALLAMGGSYYWFHLWRQEEIATYQREFAAIQKIKSAGDITADYVTDAPDWLARHLGYPQYLRRVTTVKIVQYSKASGETKLAMLHDLPRLEKLSIQTTDGAALSDRAVQDLRALTGLRSLTLHSLSIAPERLHRLKLGEMKRLEELAIFGYVHDAGLAELSNLHSLKRLTLFDSKITSKGINAHLSGLTQLEEIDLTKNLELDDSISHWLGMQTNLRKVALSNTMVANSSMSELSNLLYLRELDVSVGTLINDACISDLITMPSLQVLTADAENKSRGLTMFGLQRLRSARQHLVVHGTAANIAGPAVP